MSYWIETYEDYRRNLALYDDSIDIAPELYMRYAADGLRDIQRKTQAIRRSKTLQSTNGTVFPLIDPVFGDDVDILRLVVDPYGAEIFPQGDVWHQDTLELATKGRNEFPWGFAFGKRGTVPYPTPNVNYPTYIENRVYWRDGHQSITVYPPLPPNSSVNIRYTVYFHPFTQNSTQWAGWFPLDTNFWNNFTQVSIPSEIDRLAEGWILYATWKTLLARRQDLVQLVKQAYNEFIELTIVSQQSDDIGLTSPYRIMPRP